MKTILEGLDVVAGERAELKNQFVLSYEAVIEAYQLVNTASKAYNDNETANREKLAGLQQEQAGIAEQLKSVTTTAEGKALLAQQADIEQEIKLHDTVTAGVDTKLKKDITTAVVAFYDVLTPLITEWYPFSKEIVVTASVKTVISDEKAIEEVEYDVFKDLMDTVNYRLSKAGIIKQGENFLVTEDKRIYLGRTINMPDPQYNVLKALKKGELALR
ncbi:hypothetical protein [Carnobacterium sp.]|uniref:hypothetical protein n=1 Tax=Carnobacterium sp. TaxID=48221 RepID=UPI0028ADC6F4|nr:hypothetical protein [Carnobacterium sp.]